MRKAISPIVSIILLLVMTISAASLAFIWFNMIQGGIQESTGAALESSSFSDCSRIRLLAIRGNGVTVQNTGCDDVSSVKILINGVLTDYDLDSPLSPGQTVTINYATQPSDENLCVEGVLGNAQSDTLCSYAYQNTPEAGFACINNDDCSEDNNVCTSNPSCVDGNCTYPAVSDGQYTGCTGTTGCSGTGDVICACLTGVCSDSCGDLTCQAWENSVSCSDDCVAALSCSEGSCSAPYIEFSGDILVGTESMCPCCGDDAVLDNFYNSTHYCSYGGVVFSKDNLYTFDDYGDRFNSSSSKGVCELDNNVWFLNGATFADRVSKSIGNSGEGNTIGDMNNDGNLDILATALESTHRFSYFEGYGNGTFKTRTVKNTGQTPRRIAVGDFDNDGNLDVVTSDYTDNTFSYFEGNGDGTFVDRVTSSTATGPSDIAVGDFDNDGNLDVATSDQGSSVISCFIGYGNGSFLPRVSKATGFDPYAITIGDINNDGNLDVLTANLNGHSFSYLAGYGDGTFANAVTITAGTPYDLTVGDFDNDGNLDVVVADTIEGQFSYYKGNGDGSFGTRVIKATGNQPWSVAAGDFDNDGNLDLTFAQRSDNVFSYFEGYGNGSFLLISTKTTGDWPQHIALGDWNNDGDLDVVTTDRNGYTISIFENTGISGTGGPCCETGDTFSNSTNSCTNGVFS